MRSAFIGGQTIGAAICPVYQISSVFPPTCLFSRSAEIVSDTITIINQNYTKSSYKLLNNMTYKVY